MTYTPANENRENRSDLSAKCLKKTQKKLKESLDTKERIIPERRRANIEEVKRVLRVSPFEIIYGASKSKYSNVYTRSRKVLSKLYGVYKFIMEMEMQKMQEVLQRDFIAGWDSMNLYDCMSDSFELSQILSHSANTSEEKPWRAAVQLRLEERLIASKRASDNLERVHDAYSNAVPLATSNGSYDSLYITEGLFPPNIEINQTYTRLRRHITRYIEHIAGLFRSYIADGHVEEIILNCKGFLEASVEYGRDMSLYESLVIRQPLQRIINIKNNIKQFKENWVDGNRYQYMIYKNYDEYNNKNMLNHWDDYNRSHVTYKISEYLYNLKNERKVSKLSLAASFTSAKITKLVDKYQDSVKRSYTNVRKLITIVDTWGRYMCIFYNYACLDSLLVPWYTKQYDQYNRASDDKKAAMENYFMRNINSAIYRRIVRHDYHLYGDCLHEVSELIPSNKVTNISNLWQLTTFKNKMASFLRKSRLDGTFFRYVCVI